MVMNLPILVTRVTDIANERTGITTYMALRFARYSRDSPAFWMDLQGR